VRAFDRGPTDEVRQVSDGLIYRDFITVGLLVDELEIKEDHPDGTKLLADNWIYIQEPDVMVGRLQVFNNWSPWMVADRSKVWLGMEYFVNETDEIWSWPDERLKAFGAAELAKLGFIAQSKVIDATVIRMPKTYPAYFGTYDRFHVLRDFFDGIENLFLVGRNGMHRYNNQDHSMLTAMTAVDNIIAGRKDKRNIWDVNTEKEYHEEVERHQGPPEQQPTRREPLPTRVKAAAKTSRELVTTQ
jgi:protoporphyrinogen oxidase